MKSLELEKGIVVRIPREGDPTPHMVVVGLTDSELGEVASLVVTALLLVYPDSENRTLGELRDLVSACVHCETRDTCDKKGEDSEPPEGMH